ncbi:hypothetical protein SAMN05660649_04131 [Desulfotomaculum arcticum]|uniref:Uncharacterized protein n=1 Tax=Desulfotruncus arcticus DSM 17038 TaxID=1121424 RepID=A0A1I2XUW8_9FIRM|nr:hypothetical protein [Desulfotruncus arcticus]SFH17240.1 hypothetical protein SAMN05660649_04131 [Desulfotomaculum arcticum] [Desulfotruncus arcticus DSM 17038]
MEVRGLNLVLVLIAVIAIGLSFISIALPSGTFPNSSPGILYWNIPCALISFSIAMYFCFKK